MAKIPTAELERLKRDIPLTRLVEASGIKLKKSGKDLIGRCPFHEDKTPSLVISETKNVFHCFGCDASGTVIDWKMKTEGLSFRHAVEKLRASLSLSTEDKPVITTAAAMPLNLNTQADDQELLQQVVAFYHATLKESTEALTYLKQRGIDDPELINTFKLGYANRTLGYRLPVRNNASKGGIRSDLQRIGLLRKSGHEHFTGSIVVPVFNEHDHIVEIYGRKILGHKLRKNTPQHLYLPGPHQGLWNHTALIACTDIILCEALIDAMSFWVNGFKNVTASYGVYGFTEEHLALFKQHNIQRVLIAYDRDEAGDTAANTLAEKLIKENIECLRVQVPKDMDINEYMLSAEHPQRSLAVILRSAMWLGGKPQTENSVEHTHALSLHTETPATEKNKPAARTTANENNTAENPRDIHIGFEDRHYRVRGLEKNNSLDQMKITLRVMHEDLIYIDSLELYAAKARQHYIQQAANELRLDEDIIKRDLGKLLCSLEEQQEQQINKTLTIEEKTITLSAAESEQALALLKNPELIQRISHDIQHSGLVGENSNALMAYLCGVSRKLSKPLAMLIQSTSAAGKSRLMDAVLAFMPEEDKTHYSAMTGQSLYYMSGKNLKHKILAVAEEQGASQASYALKLLQSEGQLTIASTGKNPTTGNLETQEYHVEGPVMLCLTTTAIDIDEELLNRCIVLTVNEDRQQTAAIHQRQRQRRTLEGLLQQHSQHDITTLHQNAQRLLKPLAVVNPYAQHLTFINDRTRTRRDHEKYLTLIDTIALLHQHQREIKHVPASEPGTSETRMIEYIEVTLNDIDIANTLAHEILGRTLDELPPQTRCLLNLLQTMVEQAIKEQSITQKEYLFSRKDIRAYIHWSDTQLRVHLERLVEMEYVLVHRGSRGQRFVYELLYDGEGQDDQRFMVGLINIDTLKKQITLDSSRGNSGDLVGGVAPRSRGDSGSSKTAKIRSASTP